MSTLLYVLFWLSLFLIIYNYLLYPLIVFIASLLRPLKHSCYTLDAELPSVCLIIPAIGDVDIIRTKVRNMLRLSYPDKKLILLAVSDKNDKAVQTMLAEYKNHHIFNFSVAGIESNYQALDIGAKFAKTSVVIFSDIRNEFNDMTLKNLARHFKDSRIGAVSGVRSLYTKKASHRSIGENLYWKYETFIKNAESRIGSITGAAGELLAVRKSLYQTVARDYINFDSAIAFKLIKQGYRVIQDDEAVSLMASPSDRNNGFQERAIQAKGGFQTLFRQFSSLIPPKNWFAFSYLSHKVLRLMVPFLLLTILITPFFLLGDPLMLTFAILQILFYAVALYGWFVKESPVFPAIVNLASWYTSMNIAVLAGFARFLFRR